MRIGVVNCGISNIGSVLNMISRAGAKPYPVHSPDDFGMVDRLALPGVGAFDAAVSRLQNLGLWEPLQEFALIKKKPVLGICLGMHLFADTSEEGHMKGLGWIPGRVIKMTSQTPQIKIPHMGWNSLDISYPCPFFEGFTEVPRFYFVHSFKFVPESSEATLTTTVHGSSFTSTCQRGQLVGVQFHPEKSHRFGLKFFENYIGANL